MTPNTGGTTPPPYELGTNTFLVGMQGERVRILNSRYVLNDLTPDEAVKLAAWLIATAGPFASPGVRHTSLVGGFLDNLDGSDV